MRVLLDYQRPTADGRIVIGGSAAPNFAGDALSQATPNLPSSNLRRALSRPLRSWRDCAPHMPGVERCLWRRLQRRRGGVYPDCGAYHRRAGGQRAERVLAPVRCESPDATPGALKRRLPVRTAISMVSNPRHRKSRQMESSAGAGRDVNRRGPSCLAMWRG